MGGKILITRPIREAEKTAQILKARGFDVIIEPMLTISAVNFDLPEVRGLDALIFTSQNGVRFFDAPQEFKEIPVVTVGEKTAALAKELGYKDVQCLGADMAELAQGLNQLNCAAQKTYGYVRGVHTAGNLKDSIDSPKINMVETVVYDSIQSTQFSDNVLKNIENKDVRAVLFYSRRAAQAFADCAAFHANQQTRTGDIYEGLKSIQALCLAPSMVEYLDKLPMKDIKVSASPNEETLLSLL